MKRNYDRMVKFCPFKSNESLESNMTMKILGMYALVACIYIGGSALRWCLVRLSSYTLSPELVQGEFLLAAFIHPQQQREIITYLLL